MQLECPKGRRFLMLDAADNVVTLLDEKSEIQCLDNGMVINGNIPFGHKISLLPIARGDAIIKYGVRIGVATSFIEKGEHVHVHNCE
ncbi:MAG: hypothetical protein GWP24_05550 [Alphaproteobacteria bacterium]|nr:hypothetical protein [Alphaproteobacteria bacterium]